MSVLRTSIQDLVEYSREQQWERAGVPDKDIQFSRLCGIDAEDVGLLREFSSQRYLIVTRCPKRTARAWHGVIPPKGWAVKQKTGSSGVVVTDDHQMRVSDYDLMSVWRGTGDGWRKVFISAANGAPRGRWSHEAHALVLQLNAQLVSRIQHGCLDDYQSAKNPGVDPSKDHFAAFYNGVAKYLPDVATCATFYRDQGLEWPYSLDGRYEGPTS